MSHLEFADLCVELVDLLLLLGRDLRHLTLNLLHYSHLQDKKVNARCFGFSQGCDSSSSNGTKFLKKELFSYKILV